MPRTVRTYRPSRRPRSTHVKPQPQKRNGAATSAMKGTMIAISVAIRAPSGARAATHSSGGKAATGSATGKGTISVTADGLAHEGVGGDTRRVPPPRRHGPAQARPRANLRPIEAVLPSGHA